MNNVGLFRVVMYKSRIVVYENNINIEVMLVYMWELFSLKTYLTWPPLKIFCKTDTHVTFLCPYMIVYLPSVLYDMPG